MPAQIGIDGHSNHLARLLDALAVRHMLPAVYPWRESTALF
jgi:hypothetical protein